MPITKEERVEIIAAEQDRLEHGLFAAELDLRISQASPADLERLEAAEARLAEVKQRMSALESIAAQVEQEAA